MGDGDDSAAAAVSATARLAGATVLVVEDEAIVAVELELTLAEFGCAVLGPAVSVADALALLDAGGGPPDAALLDVGLRGERSTAVAETLARAGVPFAVVTGYGDGFLDSPALAEAPRLAKPYDAAQVRDMLLALLGRGRAGG